MKKALLTLMCMATMMVAGTNLKAQEVTITLNPGWTWISYLGTDTLDLATALGSFTPAVGDIIKSQTGNAIYMNNGVWRGSISQFYLGYGYMYKSNRTEPVMVTFQVQQPAPQVVVTTSEPTDITATSAIVGGTVTMDEGNHLYACGVCWDTVQMPTVDENHTSDNIGTGISPTTLTGLTPSTTYYVRAYVVTDYGLAYGEEQSFTTLDGDNNGNHEYVDLGLPSGTLWATCNVGANAPEEYGDYFAWGETQPKDYYDWSTYQYCNGSQNTLTKYCDVSSYGYNNFTDELTTLLPEDDAATANWGNVWRMPTREEWQELCNNTTVTWTNQDGVNGYLFTASNGNSIFLPAAGCRVESNLNYAASFGFYWSSSRGITIPNKAYHLYFPNDSYLIASPRRAGLSIRPVCSISQTNAPTGAIDGLFTINANGDQVYFSQGNLQYQASTNTWRFAENQWDYVGADNSNISQTNSGWIDLFGWGTSGYNHGANCYQPWSTSYNIRDYNAYGDYHYNLYEQTGQADWGYNAISNGGNMENSGWRTLTINEWNYLINSRPTLSGIRFAKGKVNNVNGVILLPTNWESSIYELVSVNDIGSSYSENDITSEDWTDILEVNGAVFLPMAGRRSGSRIFEEQGCYWSSSNNFGDNNPEEFGATLLSFSTTTAVIIAGTSRTYGLSVRLVQDYIP